MAPKSPTEAPLVAGLLLVAALRHYGYDLFPAGMRGMASKGLGAVLILALLWALYSKVGGKPMLWLALWLTWEELQVAMCSLAYIVSPPWSVPDGASICSALVGLDLGAFGICAVLAIAVNLSTLTGAQQSGGGEK